MKLVLLGPPGAGKGSLAQLLKVDFGFAHISTGDLLRDEMKKDSELGLKVKELIAAGQLVPDEVVTEMIDSCLSNQDIRKQGLMLDGYPRTAQQAEDLDKILSKYDTKLDYVIKMGASEEIILMRLTGRRICKDCGQVYHMTNHPPRQAGECDKCGGSNLYQRSDDKEETILNRLKVYYESTSPIIEYYGKSGKILEIDGDLDTDKIKKTLASKFDE